MIRILIADDHQAVADALKLSLDLHPDIEVLDVAYDGKQLLELVRLKNPDIVITDIRMPEIDGITATEMLSVSHPATKIIAFSMFDQDLAILKMQKAGAKGYVLKNAPLDKLLTAVNEVYSGKVFFDRQITIVNQSTKQDVLLSKREHEILKLIGEGFTSLEIASKLFIAKTTVDTHRKNIAHKLNLEGRHDLLKIAVERKYDF